MEVNNYRNKMRNKFSMFNFSFLFFYLKYNRHYNKLKNCKIIKFFCRIFLNRWKVLFLFFN